MLDNHNQVHLRSQQLYARCKFKMKMTKKLKLILTLYLWCIFWQMENVLQHAVMNVEKYSNLHQITWIAQ